MSSTRSLLLGTFLIALGACGPAKQGDDTPDDDAGPPCTNGTRQCVGSFLQQCQDGAWVDQEACTAACSPTLGCVVCEPGTATCAGSTASVCRGDGSGFTDFECDAVQGMTCDPGAGGCTGNCSPQNLGSSYIGCEYYPTITANDVRNEFEFAVAIANTGSTAARVQIENGALAAPRIVMVNPQSVAVERLPWVPALKACNQVGVGDACPTVALNITTLAAKGAYRLRSDSPVTVYQFNPLDFFRNGLNSFTNDASLLLPVNVWRDKYLAAAWHFGVSPLPPWPGILAVTASQDSTAVTITTRAPTTGNGLVPAMQPGVPTTVMLNRGDALQLGNTSGDLTGSLVTSDKPIQLIGGHVCTFLPDGVRACDHLEESIFSFDALGKSYVVAPPAMPSLPNGKTRAIRIIAGEANTTLTFEPAQSVATTLANPGDFVQILNDQYFTVKSDQKILVAQYMSAQDAGGGMGDPAMALAVPVEQFRKQYLFHAPTNYTSTYVDVVVKENVTVMLDNAPIPAGRPVGSEGWTVTRVMLTGGPAGDGNHSMTSDQPFGITVYGYGQYTSYWYAGGLDLNDIPID